MPRTLILAFALLAAAALAAPHACHYRCGTDDQYNDLVTCHACAKSPLGCRVQLSGVCDWRVYSLAAADLDEERGVVEFLGPATIAACGSRIAIDDASFTSVLFDGKNECEFPYRATPIAGRLEYHNCTFRDWRGRDVIRVEGHGDGVPTLIVDRVVFDSAGSTVVRATNMRYVDVSVVDALRCGSPCVSVGMDPRYMGMSRIVNVTYVMEPTVGIDLACPPQGDDGLPNVHGARGSGAGIGLRWTNNAEPEIIKQSE